LHTGSPLEMKVVQCNRAASVLTGSFTLRAAV
jgi:hypothetical protein